MKNKWFSNVGMWKVENTRHQMWLQSAKQIPLQQSPSDDMFGKNIVVMADSISCRRFEAGVYTDCAPSVISVSYFSQLFLVIFF